MPIRDYYWRWLKTASRHSYGGADAVAGVVGYVCGIFALVFPGTSDAMTSIAAQAILWALAGVGAFRLVLAPYWMAKEDKKEADEKRKMLEYYEERAKPDFRLSFDPQDGVSLNLERVSQPQALGASTPTFIEFPAHYLRARIDCLTDGYVSGTAHITAVSQAAHGAAFQTIPLSGGPISLASVHAAPKIHGTIQFAKASAKDNKLEISGWPLILRGLLDTPSIFRLTIAVNCYDKTEEITVDVDWRGGWETITAREAAAD